MNELSKNMRARVLETLTLIASEEAQRKYQREVPHVDVPAELFNQWDDCFFPEDESLRKGFAADELDALNLFDGILSEVCEETPQELPALDEFVKTAPWHKLSQAARATLSVLVR